MFMTFSLQVGNSTKSNIPSRLLFNLAKPLINLKATRLALSTPLSNRTLSHNAETNDFARPTSHPVRGWTGKNKAFCSPGTQNGRRVIKVYRAAQLLFQHGVGLGYLFQHGVGLARTLSFGPTNYEQCLHLSE